MNPTHISFRPLVLCAWLVALLVCPPIFAENSSFDEGESFFSEEDPFFDDADDTEITYDPFEGFNRAMFTFNDKLDRYVMKPVATGYDAALPNPVKTGVSNFFNNY